MCSFLIRNIQRELDKKNITIYELSKRTGIVYELLRRVFNGSRRLPAEEFVLILEKTGIKFEKVKEWNDVSFHSAGRLFTFKTRKE